MLVGEFEAIENGGPFFGGDDNGGRERFGRRAQGGSEAQVLKDVMGLERRGWILRGGRDTAFDFCCRVFAGGKLNGTGQDFVGQKQVPPGAGISNPGGDAGEKNFEG